MTHAFLDYLGKVPSKYLEKVTLGKVTKTSFCYKESSFGRAKIFKV